MAFVSKDGFYLVQVPNSNNLVSFGGFSQSSPQLTVAFYQIVDSVISSEPSSSICPGKEYAIRVYLPAQPNDILFLTPTSQSCFMLQTATSSENVIVFQPDTSAKVIHAYVNFPASLISPSGTQIGQFKIDPNNNWQLVGYSSQLPFLLNNCRACGCSESLVCSPEGLCIPNPCTESSICGDFNGKCHGTCPDKNYSCENVSGVYQCVVTFPWFRVLMAVIAALLLLSLFFITLKIIITPSEEIIVSTSFQTVRVGEAVY